MGRKRERNDDLSRVEDMRKYLYGGNDAVALRWVCEICLSTRSRFATSSRSNNFGASR
jgi:hypothetical protein